ncbi:DUF1152 domain-containing protein [Streptomyces sp. NPDC051018]|uniref:DUF1152 domain-containing protein n=1 Tax=Streptomyces sp. NPDC051018 TaxID=3365639 RepID=UPI003789C04F
MTRLIVAAGGGGDAVAASMLDAALYGTGEPAVILTYAWDRLLVDPVPGPRSPDDFTGLRPLTPHVPAVTADTEPVAPAGSTLPRLAREIPQTITLIDPRYGAQGIAVQLTSLVEHLEPESIDLLDVGGDILAHGDEPTLRSPLGDALTLAACCQLDAPVRLLVAGPGLDGELPAGTLRPLLGRNILTLAPEHIDPVDGVLEWHPSEATAMLAATARGIRGLCEVRDAGLPVPLTDEGPTVHEVDLDATFTRNRLAHAIAATATLTEAEALSREICGFSEIDYERDKALRLSTRAPAPLDWDAVLSEVAEFEHRARSRHISHTTFRHLTEALNLPGTQRDALKDLLLRTHPEQYAPPLWHIPGTE